MVKSKVIIAFTLAVFAFSQNNISAATYGSDSTVSIINPMNIPSSTDNIIKTFGCAKNGFAFADASTSCTFQSIFPVAGPISLKGGSLYLMSDLILNNTGTLIDLGTIRGANHVVELSQSNKTFFSGTNPTGKLVLNTVANTTLARAANSIAWSYDGKYLAAGILSGTGSDLYIYEFTGTSLIQVASVNLGTTVYSLHWRPNSYYLALVVANSPELRAYQFTPPSTLTARGTASGLTSNIAVTWHPRGTHVAVGGTTSTGVRVYSYNLTAFSLVATSTNSAALNGLIRFDCINWAPTGNKNDIIAITNNGDTTGTLHLYNFTGSALNHLKAYNQSKAGESIDWSPTSTYIAVGFVDGTIRTYQHTAATNIITQRYSITTSPGAKCLSASWKYDGSELAIGQASAAVNQFKIYAFNTSTYALTQKYSIGLGTSSYCLRYYTLGNSTYIAQSQLSPSNLTVYKENYSSFIFRDINLFLNGDLTLSAPLSFTGNCTINAQNNRITFTSNGSINLSPDSNLQISLATLKFTTPSAFSLQGESSNLSFKNSKIELNSDIFLNNGKFDVYDDLTITGPHVFEYQSNYTSTIHSNSTLLIDNGAIFQTGKANEIAREPLYFENVSSNLNLNNATLHTTGSGLSIKKGTINIMGNSTFDIDWTQVNTADTKVTPTNQGLVFGDGQNSSNDPWLILRGNGTRLTILNGAVVLDAATTHSMVQFYGQPQLAMNTTSTIYIKSPLTITNGWILSDSTSRLVIDPNAYFTLENTRLSPLDLSADQITTGTVPNYFTTVLDQNDSLNLVTGPMFQFIDVIQDGNVITGNGSLTGYINFASNLSELTWNSQQFLNVGDIDLNGGRIIFSQNSGISTQYSFKGSGTIDLTTKTFALGTAATTWAGNFLWIGDGAIIRLNNDVILDGTWTLSGNITIEGNGYSMDLGTTGTIILERGTQVTFNNFALYNITNQNGIFCSDNNCQITLNYTDLVLAEDFLFNKGSFYVYYDSIIMPISADTDTVFTLSYATTQPLLIDSDASLAIWPGIRFSTGRQDSSITDPDLQPIIFGDPRTSRFILDGGSLHVTSSGMIMTKGNLLTRESSNLEIENTVYPYGLVLGDGTPENDLNLNLNAGAQLTLKSGKLFYNNYDNNKINFGSSESTLAIEPHKGLSVKRDLLLNNGSVSTPNPTDVFSEYNVNTSFVTLNLHRYDYAHILDYVLTGTIDTSISRNIILDSNDKILINPGNFGINISVKKDNNSLTGIGNATGNIYFTDSNSTLTWDIPQPYNANNINLNGGRIIYTQDSGIGDGYSFVGTGTIDLTNKTFQLGTDATTWSGNLYWIGEAATIVLNNNVTIDGTWTLSGNITIIGNNYLIDLAPTGSIILERGANVTLKDFSVYNLSRQNRITCNDNTCQLTLNVTDLLMSGDYLWDKGSIFTYYNSRIGVIDGLDGIYTFSYESTRTSTIDSFAFLKILPNTRFSIGRRDSSISNPEQQPLVFIDPATSKLILDGGTLHVTSSGMIMTAGKIETLNYSSIEIENSSYPYGLILGNGVAEKDFELNIGGGYQLELTSGSLFYNNYSPNRVIFGSPASSLYVIPNSGLKAKTNLTLQNGTLESVGVAVNKDETVSLQLENIIRTFHTPYYSSVKMTTHDAYPGYKLLNGDSFYLLEGYNTKDVVADSGLSLFGGVAGFAGTLTLKNSSVTLQSDLSSPYFSNITLNGGTFIVSSDGSFGADKTFTGSGKVQLLGTKMAFGPTTDIKMTNTIYWQGVTKGSIELNAQKTSLSSTWTIGGNIILNGKGNILDLSNHGKLTIRPNSTLSLENISLKGLGQNFGNINFMDDTATLRLANAYLELDDNMSTTIGGILVNGPTIIGLKNFNWTLDQNASMTVDGATLWQDPLDKINHGKIKFGTGSDSKYLSLVSSGTIKTAANLDILTTETIDLQQQITNNSNAIIKLDETLRTDSNAFAYEIKNNSNAIVKLSESSGTLPLNNSNAIVLLDRKVRVNSNAMLYLNRTSSNALLFGDRNNSNAIIKLDRTVRTNSNAFAYEIKNNSNSIIKNVRDIRNNSNAIKFETDHFISVNNGKVTALGAINGSTNVDGMGLLSSPIDLQDGTLTLGSDMILSNQTTIESSGNFDLQGNAMIFGGDLTLPANTVIKVVSSGVLDGQGHALDLSSGAKLIVDNNVTLTLRNMTWMSHESTWPIQMQTATSKLTLQNSALCFDRDLTFTQGQMFIHGDVFVTGTNKFSYASTGTSYVAPHSTLYFDTNSTFSYSPRLTNRHTHSERNLIKLIDKTSSIFFDECSLNLPDSGWQLTNGTIYFNNKVAVYGQSTQENSLELGDGTIANDSDIQLLSGANIENYGYVYVNPGN